MSRAERRENTKKKVAARRKKWAAKGISISDGKLKKNHFGCGCGMCKPWKNGAKNDDSQLAKANENEKSFFEDMQERLEEAIQVIDTMKLSQKALAKIWDTPEEDEAWKCLQNP